ncbi:MAG: hypothetical protein V4484_23155 [Pseudomonadota bacterium]
MDPTSFSLPSAAYLFGGFIFSVIGFAAFRYGKKMESMNAMLIGVALMLFSYFISATWLLYLIGAALCAALYVFRE